MKPQFLLDSPETGTTYHVYVNAPEQNETSRPLASLIFMDGDDQFSAGVEAYRDLRKEGGVPPLLLVGVGYGASYAKAGNRRGRDYTPTHHSDEPSSGGADQFLAFVKQTLWPTLAAVYPLDPQARGVAGHSLGSLFVLSAMIAEPLFFTYYLASAPSIWWDSRSLLRLIQERHAHRAQLPARLFLSVGEKDSRSMVVDLDLLEQQLRDAPFQGLVTTSRRFPRKNHFNVLPDAFRAGMFALYARRDGESDGRSTGGRPLEIRP